MVHETAHIWLQVVTGLQGHWLQMEMVRSLHSHPAAPRKQAAAKKQVCWLAWLSPPWPLLAKDLWFSAVVLVPSSQWYLQSHFLLLLVVVPSMHVVPSEVSN